MFHFLTSSFSPLGFFFKKKPAVFRWVNATNHKETSELLFHFGKGLFCSPFGDICSNISTFNVLQSLCSEMLNVAKKKKKA